MGFKKYGILNLKGGWVMTEKEKSTKKKKISSKVIFLTIGIVTIVGGGLLLNKLLGSSSAEKLAEASEHLLEQYVLETYSGDKSLNDIVYGFTNVMDEDELYITDFSNTDVYVDEFDLENFSGSVEYNEMNHVYHFANGNVSDDAPRIDDFTRRVPIAINEGNELPLIYQNLFYNDLNELDVDYSYFIGDIDYAIIQKFDHELNQLTWISYVLDGTYPYVISEVNSSQSNEVEITDVMIGDVEYLRYEIVQPIE